MRPVSQRIRSGWGQNPLCSLVEEGIIAAKARGENHARAFQFLPFFVGGLARDGAANIRRYPERRLDRLRRCHNFRGRFARDLPTVSKAAGNQIGVESSRRRKGCPSRRPHHELSHIWRGRQGRPRHNRRPTQDVGERHEVFAPIGYPLLLATAAALDDGGHLVCKDKIYALNGWLAIERRKRRHRVIEDVERQSSFSTRRGRGVGEKRLRLLTWRIADSTPCRAMIPRDVGPAFHGKPGQDSTASRAG